MIKKGLSGFLAVILLASFALPASADQIEDLVNQVKALATRVDALETKNSTLAEENSSLKAEVNLLKGTQSSQAADISDVKAKAATFAAVPSAAPSGNFLKTKFDTELYGFVKADLVWASNEANTKGSVGNGTVINYNAPFDNIKKKQGTFNGAAQDTRLGLNIKPAKLADGGQVTGKIEFDFAHSAITNSSSGTYTPRLRLAYVDLGYDKWSVRAGHDWDFFAPVNTNLLNSANAWRAGNVGYRHPQAYLTNKWGEYLGGKWTTKIGVIDSDDWTQENSNVPVAGAYAQYDTKILGVASSFGVGGIFGTSTTDAANALNVTTGSEGNKTNEIYAVVVNTTLKFTDWLSLKAKGYQGEKLDKFLVNNGVGTTNGNYDASTKSLHSIGGFTELTYNPFSKLESNTGFGYDGTLNSKSDFTTSTTFNPWKSNETYWTNLKYSLSKDVIVGLEYQHFDTHFIQNALKSTDDRVESSFILKF